MSIHLPIRANDKQTAADTASTDRRLPEPDLADIQQFERKTVQLQQASTAQGEQNATDTVITSNDVETPQAVTKEATLMDVFYKQLTDSILKDIITKGKIEIDQD